MKERVIAFESYDKKRNNPVQLKLKEVKTGATFNIKQVTYKILKVFKQKSKGIQGEKCIEIKMTRYRIANTVTTFSHKCPAKKGELAKMNQEMKDTLVKKYGQKNVDAWETGKVKMKIHLSQVCPECKCIFWKEKHEDVPSVEVISVSGKKRLKKRK